MILLLKKYLLLIIACCFTLIVNAQLQPAKTVSGFVCTRGTSVRVALVMVVNKQNKAIVFTDDLGNFTIKATKGDTLEFNKDGYSTAQWAVAGQQDIVIFIQQVTHLAEVTVKGQTKKQEMSSIMDDYRKKGVYYGGRPPVASVINSPINALYAVFGKDARNAKHFAAYAKNEEEAAQDSRKYNKYVIKRVTALPDDEVEKFMFAYKPMHEDLLKWTDYDVILYIKKSFESYKKFGAHDLPKLD